MVKQMLLQASQDENRAHIVKQTSGIVSLRTTLLFSSFYLRFLSYLFVQLSAKDVKFTL